jgi:hypothetical protein
MATYKVVLKPSVEKDLRVLPKSMAARIMKRIRTLSDDPFPEQSIKLGRNTPTGYGSEITALSTESTKGPNRGSFITFDIVERSIGECETTWSG